MALAGAPATARLFDRPLSIREQVEAMTNAEHSPLYSGQHTLLMPVGLRLEQDYLCWDRLDLRPVAPSSTRRCLWEFAALPSVDEDSFLRFIRRWGVLDWGEDLELVDAESEGCRGISAWVDDTELVNTWLRAFALSESGDCLTAEALWPLADYVQFGIKKGQNVSEPPIAQEESDRDRFFEQRHLRALGIPPEWQWLASLGEQDSRLPTALDDTAKWEAWYEIYVEVSREHWSARWQVERQAGTWLAAQRWLVSQALNFWIEPYETMVRTHWDDTGRRIEYMAYGVKEIVGAHMASIFAAPMAGVYLCSVCDRPFELDDTARRRPREGARRYCGEACRLVARRESNRAAWHRHKDEWRRARNNRAGL